MSSPADDVHGAAGGEVPDGGWEGRHAGPTARHWGHADHGDVSLLPIGSSISRRANRKRRGLRANRRQLHYKRHRETDQTPYHQPQALPSRDLPP
jgi:hypothetical protein